MDRQLERRVASTRPFEDMGRRVGAAAPLPPLPLARPEAQGDHGGESWSFSQERTA